MRKLTISCLVVALAAVVASAAPAFAAKPGGGNAASSKAVFSTNTTGLMFTEADPTVDCTDTGFLDPSMACTDWMDLFDLPEAIKTSHTGALEAVVSLECALWTSSSAVAEIGASGSGGSRAGIEVRVSVDGVPMIPGNVVYCDRLQWIQLTIPNLFVLANEGQLPVMADGPFVVDLFQRTKNAHSFHFYQSTPATEIHSILVEARGIVQCSKDGLVDTCANAGVDEVKFFGEEGIAAGTMAVIGKSTVVIEEHQNWRVLDDGV